MNKKYELTDETITVSGTKLYRIRALRDFGFVSKGDLGGFIESEENLEQSGDGWMTDSTRVSDNARVAGGVSLTGEVWVLDDVWLTDEVCVYGNIWLSGNGKLSGDMRVCHGMRATNADKDKIRKLEQQIEALKKQARGRSKIRLQKVP